MLFKKVGNHGDYQIGTLSIKSSGRVYDHLYLYFCPVLDVECSPRGAEGRYGGREVEISYRLSGNYEMKQSLLRKARMEGVHILTPHLSGVTINKTADAMAVITANSKQH